MLKRGDLIHNTYEVLEPIGEGAAGLVYTAWHMNLKKKVVIKKIKDHYVGHINERREADILKNLHHQYLPQVYDFIQMGPEVYTIIDYVDGNTMTEIIKAGLRFDEKQVITWLLQLLDALEYLHSQNPPIIHSDIKPSNIMVDRNGKICLIDFNISFGQDEAKTQSGYSEGFASPEQLLRSQLYSTGGNYRGIRLDQRSDIFSLGASIYSLMAGESPARRMRENRPLWENVTGYDEGLIRIISKALAVRIKDRFQTAAEMKNEVLSLVKKNDTYRKLKRGQLIFTTVTLCLMIAGSALTYYGFLERLGEQFQEEYEEIEKLAQDDRYDEAIRRADETLRDKRYTRAMKQDRQREADLYYIIANCQFEQEDYSTACENYAYAVELNTKNTDTYRDYAIAEARQGHLKKAQEIAETGERKGLSDDGLDLVYGEIALKDGQYADAIDYFDRVIQKTGKEEILFRAYVQKAKTCRDSGNDRQAVETLTEARQKLPNDYRTVLTRQLGISYLHLLESEGIEGNDEALQEAEECFRQLTEDPVYATKNDWLNLVELKHIQKKYAEAEQILIARINAGEDEYEYWRELALIEIAAQGEVPEESRDYHTAYHYYEEAESRYESKRREGRSDDKMQLLEKRIQEIIDKGWEVR